MDRAEATLVPAAVGARASAPTTAATPATSTSTRTVLALPAVAAVDAPPVWPKILRRLPVAGARNSLQVQPV